MTARCRLLAASLTLPTIRGPIHVDFDSSSRGFTLNVQLPGNTSAEVQLPYTGEGSPTVQVDGSRRAARTVGQTVVIDDIGPGPHRIEVK